MIETYILLLAIVHYIGRSLGLDCECDDYHVCEVVALGAGRNQTTYYHCYYVLI